MTYCPLEDAKAPCQFAAFFWANWTYWIGSDLRSKNYLKSYILQFVILFTFLHLTVWLKWWWYLKKKLNEDKFDFHPIGSAMRTARLSEGWTQEEAAEKLSVEQPYYQRLERYGQHPGLQLFYKITRLFQISVDEYFFPNTKPTKTSGRRRLDTLLDKLEDKELQVLESTARALLRAREW